MKKLLTLALLLCFIHNGLATTANAQVDFESNDEIDFDFDFEGEEEEEGPKVVNPFDDKYKPNLKAEKNEAGGLLPNYFYYVGLIRKPGATPDDINLFIFSPGSIIGCVTKEQPNLETTQLGPALRLKLTEGSVDVDFETVRYYHYECKPETGMVEMHLTLSKKKLKRDKVKKLVIVSEAVGPFNDIMLDIKDDRIIVTSEMIDLSQFDLPTPQTSTTQTHWLYPENTMILFSNAADMHDANNMKQLRALARRHGLMPLDEIIEEFEPHHTSSDKLYVIDTAGRYKDKLTDQNDTFKFGTIDHTELFFGASGPYEKAVPKAVFAKLPGMYE